MTMIYFEAFITSKTTTILSFFTLTKLAPQFNVVK